MKNSVIRKFIVVILSIIFLIQPLFHFIMGIGTVNAWQYTTYNLQDIPKYNRETERIVGQQTYFRYTFRVYGSQNGLKIWNDDMSSLDDTWVYTNNKYLGNQVHIHIARKGENHLRRRTGQLLPSKRREGVGLTYYATYTTDWTTKVTYDARTLCNSVRVVAANGIVNATLTPQKEIIKTETKTTYFIGAKPKETTNNTSTSSSSSTSSQSNVANQFIGPINEVSKYNKPTTTPFTIRWRN